MLARAIFIIYKFEDRRKDAENIAAGGIRLPYPSFRPHQPRKLGDVGSSSTGSDIFRVFSSIFKFVKKKIKKMGKPCMAWVKEQAQDSCWVCDGDSEIIEMEGRKLAFMFSSLKDDDVSFGGEMRKPNCISHLRIASIILWMMLWVCCWMNNPDVNT